jgi:hypothetical protein
VGNMRLQTQAITPCSAWTVPKQYEEDWDEA